MPENSQKAGGTSGARNLRDFQYSTEERERLRDAGCEAAMADHLEAIARLHLASLTTSDIKTRCSDEKRSWTKINDTAATLLEELERQGYWDSEILLDPENDPGEGDDLVSHLLRLQDFSEKAADLAESENPHLSSNVPWRQYLRDLCRFWHHTMKMPVGRRQNIDQAGGPMVDFLMAAAGPVKLLRAPENLTGPMTTEMASHAIRDYQRLHRDLESSRRKLLPFFGVATK